MKQFSSCLLPSICLWKCQREQKHVISLFTTTNYIAFACKKNKKKKKIPCILLSTHTSQKQKKKIEIINYYYFFKNLFGGDDDWRGQQLWRAKPSNSFFGSKIPVLVYGCFCWRVLMTPPFFFCVCVCGGVRPRNSTRPIRSPKLPQPAGPHNSQFLCY